MAVVNLALRKSISEIASKYFHVIQQVGGKPKSQDYLPGRCVGRMQDNFTVMREKERESSGIIFFSLHGSILSKSDNNNNNNNNNSNYYY